MGDFKIGTTRPPVGNIKLGGRNIYEVYSGPTKVWPSCSDIIPAEITLGGQIWQNKNSVVTAKSGGGNISIVTSPSAWNSAFSSNTPAAAYWGFNSANANYGLYYNLHCLSVIQPPTGFRVPDSTDLTTLATSSDSGSSLSNNDCGLWPPSVNTIPDLNTAGWNGQGRGYLSVNGSGDVTWESTVGSGSGASARSNIWNATQPSGQGMYVFQLTYSGATTPPQINKQLPTYITSFPPGLNNFGFNIRFVKDAVTNTGLYGNFTGSPDDTQSGIPNIYTQTSQTSFNTSNNQQNRVATSIITNSTYDEFRFKAKINNGSFTMNSVQIFAYSDSARTNLVAQTNPWTGPVAMTSSYQDPWGSLTLSTPSTYFLKVSFNLTSSGQQGYQLTLT